MSTISINPYLIVNGTAEQAIGLYERALGAKVEEIRRFGDVPGDTPDELKNRIIHAALRIGESALLISDAMPHEPVTAGSGIEVCLQFEDLADMAARFDALAAGGTVRFPLQDMFWGARFGLLTDAFGVRWMFNCPLQKK